MNKKEIADIIDHIERKKKLFYELNSSEAMISLLSSPTKSKKDSEEGSLSSPKSPNYVGLSDEAQIEIEKLGAYLKIVDELYYDERIEEAKE